MAENANHWKNNQQIPAEQREKQELFDPQIDNSSFQELLVQGIGQYAMLEFVFGQGLPMRREGILTNVGEQYLVLYEEHSDTYLLCESDSLVFVTFFNEGGRPEIKIRQPQAVYADYRLPERFGQGMAGGELNPGRGSFQNTPQRRR